MGSTSILGLPYPDPTDDFRNGDLQIKALAEAVDTKIVAAYTHDQGSPSATWTVTHNLGYRPNVAVVDSAGTVVEGLVTYVDSDTLTVEFEYPFGGKAYCS